MADKLESFNKSQPKEYLLSLQEGSGNIKEMMDNLLRWALTQTDQLASKMEKVEVSKDIGQLEYFQAIDKMILGKKHISSAFAAIMMSDQTLLTPRELDVLKSFADGLTYKEIGANLTIKSQSNRDT